MRKYLADLHIHTVLSPCGSLEMSPGRIVQEARNRGLDIIGITDHNSTRQCAEVVRRGKQEGIVVICGAEVTTKEEVHCLTFFEDFDKLQQFQKYLDIHLPEIENDPFKFGYQVWVDQQEQIIGEEHRLLISAINQSIDEVEQEVHRLSGLFLAAHIDKTRFSLISQLGFVPPELRLDGVGVSPVSTPDKLVRQFPWLHEMSVITASDAHMPGQIGMKNTCFLLNEPTFAEIVKALRGEDGRRIVRD
ncbi:PHP domain-containing protein [Marinilabiliaceae bacterium JC017]|nr:PHP domain-containing protein [Marinilabiliaceae bacterium JC017]